MGMQDETLVAENRAVHSNRPCDLEDRVTQRSHIEQEPASSVARDVVQARHNWICEEQAIRAKKLTIP